MKKRRNSLGKTGSGLAAADLARNTSESGQVPPRKDLPNILLILADMQRWETIAGRSVCRMPNVNRLASQGVLFNSSYTATAPCCPSRAMLATGSYHWHNGVFNQVHSAPSVSRDMFPDVVTYYNRLRAAGYHMGYIGKWHASYKRTPLDFGFHEIRAPIAYNPELLKKIEVTASTRLPRSGAFGSTVLFTHQWPGALEPARLAGIYEGPVEATHFYHLAEECINAIRQYSERKEPWHLELHFSEGDERLPLRKYFERYDPKSIPVPPHWYETFENKPGMHRMEAESWGVENPEHYQIGRACYYASAEQRDAQIGRILDALERTGQRENTLVIYAADHGDMCGDHRMWVVGWMPYEGMLRIPMVMNWPARIGPGLVSDHLVQLHDLAHTIVDIIGEKALPFRDGVSLLPLAEDPKRSNWRDMILNAFYGGEYVMSQRLVITDRYKYVFNGFDFDELYDLEDDPVEMDNKVNNPAYQHIVNDMRARLYELMYQTEDPFGDNPPARSGCTQGSNWNAPRYLPRGKRL